MKQKQEPSKERRTFRVRSALQDNVLSLLSIVSVILGTLLVVFFMLWFLYKADILSIPLADLFGRQGEETAAPYVEPTLIDFLKNAADGESAPDSPAVRFSGSFDTLYALLAGASYADSYYLEAETAYHSGKTAAAYTVKVWKDGAYFRITRCPVGEPQKGESYLSDGKNVLFTDMRTSRTSRFPVSDAFSMEALAGIPSVGTVTNDPSVVMDAASYTESGDEVIYFIRFHHDDAAGMQVTEEYWISPGSELVLECRTYAAGRDSAEPALVFSDTLRTFRPLTDRERSDLAAEAAGS